MLNIVPYVLELCRVEAYAQNEKSKNAGVLERWCFQYSVFALLSEKDDCQEETVKDDVHKQVTVYPLPTFTDSVAPPGEMEWKNELFWY